MIEKIVSGGQTGADRGALDWAIFRGIPHGGWCPKGRLAEDGAIPSKYNLTETQSASYPQRTEWNVRDSDGTVIFTMTPKLSVGSKKTQMLAQKHHKPCLHVPLTGGSRYFPEQYFVEYLDEHKIRVLNVAGTRGSKEPELEVRVMRFLDACLWSPPGIIGGPDEG